MVKISMDYAYEHCLHSNEVFHGDNKKSKWNKGEKIQSRHANRPCQDVFRHLNQARSEFN